MSEITQNLISKVSSLAEATGEIPYKFTNDYMFRTVLERNQIVLKGLICSLLHLNEEDIRSIKILNPIEVGEDINSKEYHLDLIVCLNNNETINLEMQVNNLHDWENRSLAYLCRSYDKLTHGMTYAELTPVLHIGFLDFTLFPECPEFFATYKMMNVVNHHVYNGNFTIGVVDLTQIELATDEDKAYGIDSWAKLFKATNWDELRAIAGENDFLKGAANTMFDLSNDFTVQKRARDREDYLNEQRYFENMKKETIELHARNEMMDKEITELHAENEKMKEKSLELHAENEKMKEKSLELHAENEVLRNELSDKDALIVALQNELKKLK